MAATSDSAPQVVGLGMCTLDMFFVVPEIPDFGQGIMATAYMRQGGGPVATALVTLTRLGVSTRLIGSIGDDDEGALIRDELRQEGVDVGGLRTTPGARSRVALVLVHKDSGERGFAGRPETCPELQPADLALEEFGDALILIIDNASPATVQAASWARARGMRVVFDGTWTSEHLDRLLPLVDVPIVSVPFVRAWMPGASPRAVLDRLWLHAPQLAVLTLGEQGCAVRSETGARRYPAYPMEAVDTTGAGDAFHGGFIYGLLQGWDEIHTVRFASAVAALNCRQLGGRTALPRLQEVARFLCVQDDLQPLPL